MELTVQISPRDLKEHYDDLWSRFPKRGLLSDVSSVVLWAVVASVYLAVFSPIDRSHVVLFIVVLVVSSAENMLNARRIRRKLLEDGFNTALKEQRYRFNGDGIAFTNDCAEGRIDWSGVSNVDETDSLFRFFVGSFEAVLIPKRVLSSEGEFRDSIESWRNANRSLQPSVGSARR